MKIKHGVHLVSQLEGKQRTRTQAGSPGFKFVSLGEKDLQFFMHTDQDFLGFFSFGQEKIVVWKCFEQVFPNTAAHHFEQSKNIRIEFLDMLYDARFVGFFERKHLDVPGEQRKFFSHGSPHNRILNIMTGCCEKGPSVAGT